MEAMPRPRPPYLSHEVTRHGRTVWYVRRNGKRIRLRAEFGTPEFDIEYQAATAGEPLKHKAPNAGTFSWLIARYRETAAWQQLSLATRRQREYIFEQTISTAGNKPASAITAVAIKAGRDRRSKTPVQARHFLDTMRGLFRWAVETQMVKVDPTVGIKNLSPVAQAAIDRGLRKTWPLMKSVGQSVHGNAFGSTCCCTPAYVVATPCGSGASTCAMVSPPSRPRRPIPKSRCQSYQCLPRH